MKFGLSCLDFPMGKGGLCLKLDSFTATGYTINYLLIFIKLLEYSYEDQDLNLNISLAGGGGLSR